LACLRTPAAPPPRIDCGSTRSSRSAGERCSAAGSKPHCRRSTSRFFAGVAALSLPLKQPNLFRSLGFRQFKHSSHLVRLWHPRRFRNKIKRMPRAILPPCNGAQAVRRRGSEQGKRRPTASKRSRQKEARAKRNEGTPGMGRDARVHCTTSHVLRSAWSR
jgi:hypothetical protein